MSAGADPSGPQPTADPRRAPQPPRGRPGEERGGLAAPRSAAAQSGAGSGEQRGEIARRAEAQGGRDGEAWSRGAGTPSRPHGELTLHPWLPGGGEAGAMLAALGAVVAALHVRPGHVCLEIGAGAGNLAVTLAQMGCDATYFGLGDGAADLVARRIAALAAAVEVVDGPWRDLPRLVDGRRFDIVLLDLALTRSADRVELLRLVRESLLAPGGRLVLTGEPSGGDRPGPRRQGLSDDAATSTDGRRNPIPADRPGDLTPVLDATGFVPEDVAVSFPPGCRIVVASRKR